MFEVWSRDSYLGESELEMHDEGMHVRSGRFRPDRTYFSIREVFRMFARAMELQGEAQRDLLSKYYSLRDELQLRVRERGGAELLAGDIHIVDLEESADEMWVEVYPRQ